MTLWVNIQYIIYKISISPSIKLTFEARIIGIQSPTYDFILKIKKKSEVERKSWCKKDSFNFEKRIWRNLCSSSFPPHLHFIWQTYKIIMLQTKHKILLEAKRRITKGSCYSRTFLCSYSRKKKKSKNIGRTSWISLTSIFYQITSRKAPNPSTW